MASRKIGEWSVVISPFFTISFSFAFSMFTGASVTLNAIIEITNAFFDMFTANVVLSVLMATIAGISLVVVAFMASHTTGIVVTIQIEILAVFKVRRCPFILVVTLTAVP
jgi:hypothetical protein